ncbi:hypothetical protein J3R30DRAFT_3409947 [Lentinula aciculospora]|uniref:Ricin B lectin domain-containing protein n=1 Tax=Lentinula aciculospora TaxID=153920 RepID=A0A9W8ZXM0_9AGAR|nr:hypothetical protein J3R30DRAFT_3409947 [Lentinula aciculospora]
MALDLSKGDGKSLIGWTKHNNSNQQFILTSLGHGGGYLVQSAWNGNYATVEDGISTGVAVWISRHDTGVIRMGREFSLPTGKILSIHARFGDSRRNYDSDNESDDELHDAFEDGLDLVLQQTKAPNIIVEESEKSRMMR